VAKWQVNLLVSNGGKKSTGYIVFCRKKVEENPFPVQLTQHTGIFTKYQKSNVFLNK
jgi:hypothetical protein